MSYSKTDNTVASRQGIESFNYGLEFSTTITLPYSWSVSSDIAYTANRGLSAGYNLNEVMWNAQISKSLLKNNRGLLSLRINDILQQKLSVRRNIAATYVEDVRNNTMTGYFMVSFTYRFNNIGGGRGNRGRQRGESGSSFDGGGREFRSGGEYRGRGAKF